MSDDIYSDYDGEFDDGAPGVKPGIISEEASQWDQMTLDRKLQAIAYDARKLPDSLGIEDGANAIADDLEELSSYVFKYMRDTGETI